MIKGFIFDLDGVIVFTDQLHYLAWKKIADRLGIHFDERINHRLRGVSREESLEIVLEGCEGRMPDGEEKARLAQEKNEYYRTLLLKLSPKDVSQEVRDTLRELRKRGYRLAIGSSSKNAELILRQTGIRDLFDAVSDGNQLKRSKPDPEVFLRAASLLGLKPEECGVIEDAEAGIEAARRGNMYALAINSAFGSPNADQSLGSFKELLTIK